MNQNFQQIVYYVITDLDQMGKNSIQNNNEIMIIVDECKKTIDTTSI